MEQPVIVTGPGSNILASGGVVPVAENPEIVATRIDSYDIARAFAIIGMLVVNYYVILLGGFKGDSLFVDLAFVICGRAAALFIILAGVGITLLGRKALVSGDPLLISSYRREIIKRCIILYAMGLLLWLYWRADILHFYGLFLIVGALMLSFSSRVIWGVNLFIWILSAIIFWFTEGEPDISSVFMYNNLFLRTGADLLFSGHYAAFPWLTFLLAGIWFAKSRLLTREVSLVNVFIASLVILIVAEVLIYTGGLIDWPDTDVPLDLMLWRSTFPMSPLHLLSSGASAFILLILIMWACDRPGLVKLLWPLRAMGRLSLTVYITHVALVYRMNDLIGAGIKDEKYLTLVILFYLASCLMYICFANIWCSYFKYGPFEWVLRRAVKFSRK